MKLRSILLIMLSVIVTTSSLYAQESDDGYDKLHEATVINMAANLDKSEEILSQSRTLTQKMDYALFLHAFRPQTPERDAIIVKIISEVKLLANKTEAERNRNMKYPYEEYDGSDKSLIAYLVMGSHFDVINQPWGFYPIPCPILYKRPELLDATQAFYGSSLDTPNPRSGCEYGRGEITNYPDDIITAYETIADTYGLNDYYKPGHGTMYRYAGKSSMIIREQIKLKPFQLSSENRSWATMTHPYETWSYMSLFNHAFFQQIKEAYEPAHDALSSYYQTYSGLNKTESDYAAKAGLFIGSWGAECGDSLPQKSLRQLLFSNADISDLKSYVKAQNHLDKANVEPYLKCAQYAEIDPLIHIAVKDHETLAYLWSEAQKLKLEDDASTEVDFNMSVGALNHFKKTPLMTAAQYNFTESAKFLLSKNASINAITKHPYTQYGYGLKHDSRTALMYAAANASLEMLTLLVESGADLTAKDSQGLTALDYLEGKSPAGKNSILKTKEFDLAKTLLLPTFVDAP